MKARSVVASLLIALAGCGGGGEAASSATTTTAGEFEQTWTKDYKQTTCTDWNGSMTAQQMRVAAADMLVSLRKVDGGTSLPPRALMTRFQGDIGDGCAAGVGELTIADAAVSIYIIGKSTYAPT